MKVVCLSDTHGAHNEITLPHGDLLIHAGDFTNVGYESEIIAFNSWLHKQPFAHKVVVAGNHDCLFETDRKMAEVLLSSAIYLQDNEITINGVRIYGTPWTPMFNNWAFMKEDVGLEERFRIIPDGLDILISHGPAKTILDRDNSGMSVGSGALLSRLLNMKKKPRFHIFGHIHESYGQREEDGTTHFNVSINEWPHINKPIVLEF